MLAICELKPLGHTTVHSVGWLLSKRQAMQSIGEGMENMEHSYTAGRSVKWYSHFGKLAVFYKVKDKITILLSNVTLGNLPKRVKIYAHTKTCTQIFIAALFELAQNWKENSPSPCE